MRRTAWLAAPVCALAVAGFGVGTAHAAPGPDNARGQVERGPAHANSICSFSGLNDEPLDAEEGGRVQSYGQIVRAGGKAFAPSPSLLCNGHKFPFPEAFGEEPE
jgi:hypothetical protein